MESIGFRVTIFLAKAKYVSLTVSVFRTPGHRWKMVATKMWGHPRIQSKDPSKPSSTARTFSHDIKLTKGVPYQTCICCTSFSALPVRKTPCRIGISWYFVIPSPPGWWFGTFGLFSISYMGCHPSHWRTNMFQDGYCTTNQPQSLPSCQCRRPVTGSVSVSSAAVELMMSRPDPYQNGDGFWWWEKFLGCVRPNLIRTYLRKGISCIYIWWYIYICIQWYIYIYDIYIYIMVMLFGWLY